MKEKVVELIEKRKDNFNLLKNKSNEICEAVRIIKTALENNNKIISKWKQFILLKAG